MNRWQEHRFLVDYAKKESLRANIDKHELEKRACVESVAKVTSALKQTLTLITQKGRRKDELITMCGRDIMAVFFSPQK